jgi:AmiR/NasT family two-component response regulator
MKNEKPLPKPRPATIQERHREKALERALDKVQMSILFDPYGAHGVKGYVASAAILKRLDRLIRELTKTRRALSSSKEKKETP